MAGAAVRAGWLVRLAAPSASYCTRFGTELPAAAAQAPQPSPPYGSRKPHARRVPADEDPAARAFSSAPAPGPDNKSFLWARYGEMKRLVQDLLPPGVCNLLNPSTIYANNEISLNTIGVYGFDYDYTLALYSPALHSRIYNTARDILVEQYKYPKGILKYEYWPNFAIRGLHYDIAKGLLMKIDAFHYIQLGTVYRGLKPVPDDEVLEMYDGTHHIPLHQASGFYGKGPAVKQFMDIFSLPEMTLLAVANDFFISNDIDYDPIHLYKDVTDAIRDVHIKGFMYKWIMQDLEQYILHGDETYAVLHRLAKSGKKLFLITNSPFSFVDKGMRYMVGKDWRDFFDVVIVQADKPHFFNDCVKPFRRLDSNGDLQWDKINKLEKGQVYKQGNLFDFLRLTGWRGSKVLYFGDHLYSDLADLMLRHGWRTGAIVPELETETKMVNTEQYSQALTWLQALTGLLERMQMFQDPESQQVLQDWMKERQELRGLSLRSKPELLQVLEHRNRRRDGTESGLKPSPLEQELLRWQQRREQHQQQEATGDPGGSQPEFIKVREKLRSTQQRDPSPQHASPSLISVPFPRLHHPNRKPSQFPVKHPPVALQAAASHPLSSLKASSLPSVPSKHSFANNT